MANRLTIVTAIVLAAAPFAVMAQDAEKTVETTTTTVPVEHHFSWGLLGLLGLAGLIPRKQSVVNVDHTARR